ncbi:MAG: hypothetical protein LBK50_03340 [Candidatus Nomurabacteria bacterium]|jgi:hypothetical protein|nr:hypothetical protein [Candidatus Nomurabacteria bacterium]
MTKYKHQTTTEHGISARAALCAGAIAIVGISFHANDLADLASVSDHGAGDIVKSSTEHHHDVGHQDVLVANRHDIRYRDESESDNERDKNRENWAIYEN